MDNPAQFDRAVLTIVSPGIEGGLSALKESLQKFWVSPAEAQHEIQAAHDEAKRLIGVFKMVNLDGLAVFCTEIDTVLVELAQHPGMATSVHREGLEAAIDALGHYLLDLAKGADNSTMRLFPRYQQLQQLRGLETSFDLDLFCPNLNVLLPASVLGIPQATDPVAQIKAARALYQQGLLRYLRHMDVELSLHAMQEALLNMMVALPADKQRVYWWVGAGLLNCLGAGSHATDLNVPKLLGKIDQQIRAHLAGQTSEEQPELYQMLYFIANSETVSDSLAAEIKTTYALTRYIHHATDIPASLLSKRLSVIGEHLRGAQDSWETCVLGNREGCTNFVAQTGLMESYSEKLDQNTLQGLARAIAKYAKFGLQTEHAKALTMDMAMSLLLFDRGISHYHQINEDFQQQAFALTERMKAAVNGQAMESLPIDQVVDLHRQQESIVAGELLGKEMLGNLQRIESALNAFFENPAARHELAKVNLDLQQVQGGLHMLGWQSAAALSDAFHQSVDILSKSEKAPDPSASRAIACALGVLESRLVHGGAASEEQEAAIYDARSKLDEINQSNAPIAPDLSATVVMPNALASAASQQDMELLNIFLEEADEVLAIMHENLELCHLHQESLEPLVTIRRGFHTLKGSGRMVGLNELGEVAWVLERAMNSWLQREQAVTQALVDMIAMAIPQFTDWIKQLRLQGSAHIEADHLLRVAAQVESNQTPDGREGRFEQREVQLEVEEQEEEALLAPVTPVALEVVSQKIEEIETSDEVLEAQGATQVQIGSISLSASLFKIGSEESTQHVAVLHSQLTALAAAQSPLIEYDFMRAAHTLAGVNRAMGFTAIVDLAFALEAWLQARMEHPFKLLPSQLELLHNTVNTLDRMVQDLCARQYPRASSDMLYLLNMDRDKLHVEEQAAPPSVPVAQESIAIPTKVVAAPVIEEVSEDSPLVRDDVDEQLLPVFLEEADDLVPKLEENLRIWRNQPFDDKPVQLLNRLLHTLKGSARMAGAMRIGQIAHEMEDAVLSAAKQKHEPAYWDGLTHEFDRITVLLEELRTGKSASAQADLTDRRQDSRGISAITPDRRMLEIGAERALQTNMLRVRADVIDQLVNEASEISVARARMESELRAFKDGLLELTESISRLRKQLREVEIQAESQMQARVSLVHDSDEQFDPLEFDRFTRLQELTRFMNESVHDVQTVQQTLLKNLDETTAAMSAQGRLNRELQQSLMNVRMVPFNSITDRLYRIVRQTGKELNKRANLELSGTSVELDRSVLEKMTAPFEHLLRNAMAHGLESEQLRSQSGKQAIGEIRLSLKQENNEVVFEFSDNGAGLNFPALRDKAIAQGLIRADEKMTEDQLAQLIFASGISTAGEVTEVAGRGIGMDVVRSEISALGGRIDVSSRTGVGTKFTIHLPLTLAVTQVLTVRCGESVYAIPAVMVEQVRQLKSAEIEDLYRVRQVEWNNKPYPLQYLPQLIGASDKLPESQARSTVLLLRSGEVTMALHVEELLSNHEAVVKNIGPQLARLQGIAGATVQANGRVVLILNPLQILQNRHLPTVPKQVLETLRKQPLIMVVDDSLTVRKITTRMLTRIGYDVITAKDGVDALEQLVDVMPEVMLLDVEMPRMDGFELTKRLRQDNKTKNLPIIMITSRTADKHRDHALQLGVNAYMGKPYQEDFLLERIASFVNVTHPA